MTCAHSWPSHSSGCHCNWHTLTYKQCIHILYVPLPWQPIHRYTAWETVWYGVLLTQQSCGYWERGRCRHGETDRDLLTDEILQWSSLMWLLPLSAPPSFLSHLCPPLLPPRTPLSYCLFCLTPLLPSKLMNFLFLPIFTVQCSVHVSVLLPSVCLHCCWFSQGQRRREGKNVGLLRHLSSALPVALIQQYVTTFSLCFTYVRTLIPSRGGCR